MNFDMIIYEGQKWRFYVKIVILNMNEVMNRHR